MITKQMEVETVTVCWSSSLNTTNGAYDITVITATPIVSRVQGVEYISVDRVFVVEYTDANKIRIVTNINDVIDVYQFNNVSRYSLTRNRKEVTK